MLLAAATILQIRIAEKILKDSRKTGGQDPMIEYAISDAEKALTACGVQS
jgi:hypothetical protein